MDATIEGELRRAMVKRFDTMNKLWKEEKAKVGDIFDNRNSGIIWKSRLLRWCIIDDPQPYWCLGKIWKFGRGSHFKRRIVCKSWLMRRWARCWKRERESLHQETHIGDKPAWVQIRIKKNSSCCQVFLEQSWWMRLWLKWTAPFSWVRFTRAAPGNHHQ